MNERERELAAMFTVLQSESFEAGSPAHTYFLRRSHSIRSWIAMSSPQHGRGDSWIRPSISAPRRHGATAPRVLAFMEGAAVLWLLDPDVSLVALYRELFGQLVSDLAAP
jgi:hypothetical protein